MSETRVLRFSEPELRDPVAIVGFPTVGLVGSILAGLMVRSMKLPVVAGITSPDLPPYTFVTDGRPCPQIRIMAGTPARVRRKKKAEEDAEGDKLPEKKKRSKPHDVVIVTSEIAPKPEQTYGICTSILDTLRSLGVNDVVCLEGVAGYDQSAPVGGVATNQYTVDKLNSAEIPIMNDGIVMRLGPTRENLNRLAAMVFNAVFIVWSLSFLVKLYFLPRGALYLAYLVLITKMADIGAYFIGTAASRREQGSHKLAPAVSPHKCWEGVGGGALFAIVGSLLFCAIAARSSAGFIGFWGALPCVLCFQLQPFLWFPEGPEAGGQ